MKQKRTLLIYKALILLSFLVFGQSTQLKATHLAGMELTYQYLSPDSYEVTLTLIRACESGSTSAPSYHTITAESNSCSSQLAFSANKVGNEIDITPLCYAVTSRCSGGNLDGYERIIYKGRIKLTGPCPDWKFSVCNIARNNSITSLQDAGSQSLCVYADLNNTPSVGINNSPVFSNNPNAFVCVGTTLCYNNGSFDADGDSLSYELVVPLACDSDVSPATATSGCRYNDTTFFSALSPVIYNPISCPNVPYPGNYSYQKPFCSDTNLIVDPITGNFCISPNAIEITVIAIRVKEYRNGVLIGSVTRDIQIKSYYCTNTPPVIDGATNITACANNPVNFTVYASDAQLVNLQASNIPSWATFTIFSNNTTNPYGVFSGTPGPSDIGSLFCFLVTASDQDFGCDYYSITSTSFCISVSDPNSVPVPVVSITGPNTICVGQTTNLSPSTDGFWTSSDTSVATVDNIGVVTGVGVGTATFTFTNGCHSSTTLPVTVSGYTVSVSGVSDICIGSTTTLSPNSGGTWVSSDPSVATVDNTGLVTGISVGSASFIFTNSTTGCISDPTSLVNVLDRPYIFFGGNDICIGQTTSLSPSSGGIWVSNNPSVATVTNSGDVTGISLGTATFTFTDNITGCSSDSNLAIVTVVDKPVVSITGQVDICVGSTTTLSPNFGGSWYSNNPSVASVTSWGDVTAVGVGTTTFTFVSSITGCESDPTAAITVIDQLDGFVTGPSTICVGDTTTLFPISGGFWTTWQTNVADVSNTGVVTGLSGGGAFFYFTDSVTGCTSGSVLVIVGQTGVTLTGPNNICVGQTTSFVPSTGGTWASNNSSVAAVSNSGIVTGISAGTASFYYTDSSSGCYSTSSPLITVINTPTAPVGTGPYVVCTGQSASLAVTVANGETVSWFSNSLGTGLPISNANPFIVTPTGTETYYAFASNGICRSGNGTAVTVSIGTNLSLPTGLPNYNICTGDSATLLLGVSPGGTVYWYDNPSGTGSPLSTSNPFVVSPNSNTTYYAYHINGTCSSLTALPVSITLSSIPTGLIGTTAYTICQGDTASLSFSLSSGTTAAWYDNPLGTGIPISINNPWLVSVTSDTTFYAFANNGICNSTDSLPVSIEIAQSPSLPLGDSLITICEGQSVSVNAVAPIGSSIVWYDNPFGNGAPIFIGIPLIIPSASDSIFYAFSSISGCLSDSSMILEIDALNAPTQPSGNSVYNVCIGDSLYLVASAGTGTNTSWYDNLTGSGLPIYIGDTFQVLPSIDTTYYVFGNNGFCSSINSLAINIDVHQVPEISIDFNDSICDRQLLVLQSNTNSGGGVLWNTGENTPSIELDPVYIPDSIWVSTQSSFGCENTAFFTQNNISIFSNPIALFDTLVDPYFSSVVLFQDSSFSNIVSWNWNFGDGSSSQIQHPAHTFSDTGTYIISLIVMTQQGCLDTAKMTLVVDGKMIIPNVFTPNGDGNNDFFIIPTIGIKEPLLIIKNRWGLTLFEAEGRNLYWDGRTSAGTAVSEGTYYFLLFSKGIDKAFIAGYITLLR
jgi:gliding motility-associated-like protein